jgi:hypothetical protein
VESRAWRVAGTRIGEDGMIPVGEYSDTLRALGQYLDQVGAARIEIVSQGTQWLVASGSGHEPGSDTLFLRYRLDELCKEGRLRRGASDTTGEFAFRLSQILRALGHILDASKATEFTIRQVPEGFCLVAISPDGQTTRTLSIEEIRALAAAQSRGRDQESTEILPSG